MKVSRGLTSRKHTGLSVSIGSSRYIPRWATTRDRGSAITGTDRKLFRGFGMRSHGITLP